MDRGPVGPGPIGSLCILSMKGRNAMVSMLCTSCPSYGKQVTVTVWGKGPVGFVARDNVPPEIGTLFIDCCGHKYSRGCLK